MTIKREKFERETHINTDASTDMMRIYTSETHMMRKLDKYVEESDEWKLVEVSRVKGDVVSKTYEAPKRLLSLRKKTYFMSEERRQEASERFREYHRMKKEKDEGEFINLDDEENNIIKEENQTSDNSDDANFQPEKTRPKYEKINMYEPEK